MTFNKINCKLIAICGGDCAGKETQSKLLIEHLRQFGKKVTLVEVPINDLVTYNVIYWALKNGFAKKYPTLFQVTQYINKRLFQEFKLHQLMIENDYIIFDRWSASMMIYGALTGANLRVISKLFDTLIEPDATIVITGKFFVKNDTYDVYENDVTLQKMYVNCTHDG